MMFYHIHMTHTSLVIGVTGCIGVGKSTVLALLKQRGAGTVSADALLVDEYVQGTNVYAQLIAAFGTEIAHEGVIDRHALIEKLKQDPTRIETLNRITHPVLCAKLEDAIRAMQQTFSVIAVEVPLLFEVQFDRAVDITLVITCDEPIVHERMIGRWKHSAGDEATWKLLHQHQWTQSEKKQCADYVIDNSTTSEALEKRVALFWRAICD